MRPPLFVTSLGAGVCLVLAWYLHESHTELRQLGTETQQANASNEAIVAEGKTLQAETATRAGETERRRRLALTTLSAADRARGVVGPLIERIKAERALHPPAPPPRWKPSPMPANGMYFPELMGDPKYNELVKELERTSAAHLYKGRLQAAGLSNAQIDRVLDLAAERRMVEEDFLSAARQSGIPQSEVAGQIKAKQAELMDEIQRTVGDRAFAAITQDSPRAAITVNADGTRSVSYTTERELAPTHDIGSDLILPIERRLSYSAEPLSDAQRVQLAQLVGTPKPLDGTLPLLRNQTFLQAARAVLSPVQQIGIDELVTEDQAWQKRAKLPQTPASSRK